MRRREATISDVSQEETEVVTVTVVRVNSTPMTPFRVQALINFCSGITGDDYVHILETPGAAFSVERAAQTADHFDAGIIELDMTVSPEEAEILFGIECKLALYCGKGIYQESVV